MNSLEKARLEINEIDREMAELFCRRMECSSVIGAYKRDNGLPVRDVAREAQLIEKNGSYVKNKAIASYYIRFIENIMELSREYQAELRGEEK